MIRAFPSEGRPFCKVLESKFVHSWSLNSIIFIGGSPFLQCNLNSTSDQISHGVAFEGCRQGRAKSQSAVKYNCLRSSGLKRVTFDIFKGSHRCAWYLHCRHGSVSCRAMPCHNRLRPLRALSCLVLHSLKQSPPCHV